MKDSLRTEGEENAARVNVLNTNPNAISLFTVSAPFTVSLPTTTECNSSLQFNSKTKRWIVQVISNRVSCKRGCIVKESIWHHAHATWYLRNISMPFIFKMSLTHWLPQCKVVELHSPNAEAGTFYCSLIPNISTILMWGACVVWVCYLFWAFILRLPLRFMPCYQIQSFSFH